MLHPFTLSAGDNNRQTELAAKNKKNFTRLCVEGAIAVLWNIVAAIVFVLFTWAFNSKSEQAGTGQPATRPVLDSHGGDKPQPDPEGRSR